MTKKGAPTLGDKHPAPQAATIPETRPSPPGQAGVTLSYSVHIGALGVGLTLGARRETVAAHAAILIALLALTHVGIPVPHYAPIVLSLGVAAMLLERTARTRPGAPGERSERTADDPILSLASLPGESLL